MHFTGSKPQPPGMALGPTLCWPSRGLTNPSWFPEILVLHAERGHTHRAETQRGVENRNSGVTGYGVNNRRSNSVGISVCAF